MWRSLKVRSDSIIKQAKLALQRNAFPSQRACAEELGFALSTLSRLLTGTTVDYGTFFCGNLWKFGDRLARDFWLGRSGFIPVCRGEILKCVGETHHNSAVVRKYYQSAAPITGWFKQLLIFPSNINSANIGIVKSNQQLLVISH